MENEKINKLINGFYILQLVLTGGGVTTTLGREENKIYNELFIKVRSELIKEGFEVKEIEKSTTKEPIDVRYAPSIFLNENGLLPNFKYELHKDNINYNEKLNNDNSLLQIFGTTANGIKMGINEIQISLDFLD